MLLRSDRAPGLYPRRLVHAGRPGQLGATGVSPSSAPTAISSCASTSTSPVGPARDHLFLVDNKETRYIDCSNAGLPYTASLIADVLDRTERAMAQAHCFKVMELALKAEAMATRLGNLR